MSTGPLLGRGRECGVLDQLVGATRAGRGGALVLHGQAGVGKTALLDRAAASASDLKVVRAAGAESERELPFATLHQLCAPMLDRLKDLPAPQRETLGAAFGMTDGRAPDRFLVGVAVLGLLTGGAAPVLCIVDDAQWIDQASAQALAFAARRVETEAVLFLFGCREMPTDLSGLPCLRVKGLPEREARQLLATIALWPIDERVRDQIVAEARGNPLALKQLPAGRWPAGLAGDFGVHRHPLQHHQIDERFRRRVVSLPAHARKLLLVAAADPLGDPAVIWRAARSLGIPDDAATVAADAGLLEFGTRALFPHPSARSAAYRHARLLDRQEAHRALAQAIDARTDPDRHAWHRSQATQAPDDEVAEELVDASGHAQTRGGLAAAAAFLERAATLTAEPSLRAERALSAADTTVRAGVFGRVPELLSLARTGSLRGRQAAHAELVQARFDHLARHGGDVVSPLLAVAKRFERIDRDEACLVYLDAFSAAHLSGRLTENGAAATDAAHTSGRLARNGSAAKDAAHTAGRLAQNGAAATDVARSVVEAPAPRHRPWAAGLLLDGLAVHYHDGTEAALPLLQHAIAAMGEGMPADEELRCQWPASIAAFLLWDDAAWDELTGRHREMARRTGALGELPLILTSRLWLHLLAGQVTTAASLAEELAAVTEATGNSLAPFGSVGLAAFRGYERETRDLAGKVQDDARQRGEGLGISATEWAKAVLFNGHGRYDDACVAASLAAEPEPLEPGPSAWALAEWVEAATRAGARDQAAEALRRFPAFLGTPWALGVHARSRAMLAEGERAEHLYREAIDLLAQTRMRAELARAHLVYGEWLRRENRRVDARDQLHIAFEMLGTMGLEAFAERAWRELVATGETVRKRKVDAPHDLTAQETQIALLASDGLSNPEISLQLFISARTVEWHLRKVFTKLGITSRRQLRHALPEAVRASNGSAQGSAHGPAPGSAQGSAHGPAHDSTNGPAHSSANAGPAPGSAHGPAHGPANAGPTHESAHGPARSRARALLEGADDVADAPQRGPRP